MTPLRQQYLRIKKQFPDAIVMFRLGDFYESFDDDARLVAEVCNIVLTARDMGSGQRVPLAGVPHHAVETYLARLIGAGHKVAIVEQTSEEPVMGLMTREVTRVVTPGTVVEPTLLQAKSNNYLAAVCIDAERGRAAIAHADITTGEFAVVELDAREVHAELERLHPAEVLTFKETSAATREKFPFPLSTVPSRDEDAARQILLEQFQVASLEGFGLAGLRLAPRACAAIVRYLQENQKGALAQLRGVRVYATDQFMVLDPPTRRNLELSASIRGGALKGSLLGVLDETKTAMGGRLLRQWLNQPLRDLRALNARLDRVDAFYHDTARRERVRALLKQSGDVERLTNRVVQGIASPRDVRTLGASLEIVPALSREPAATEWALDPCAEVSALVARALVSDPPANLTNGGAIARGYSAELDSITLAARNAKDWVAALERTERERTGIKSLKVGYNRVFGYYIEVTTPNLSQAPKEYIRKQTLANAERFITPELKEYESLILNAEERLVELETTLFRALCGEIAQHAPRLLRTARTLAELDVYAALAEVALRYRYARPVLDEGDTLDIHAGRHPVVELTLKDEPFVPNDCLLAADELIHIITGPNMSGKCVTGDTYVFTDAGLVSIESLKPGNVAEDTFAPVCYRVKGLDGSASATHFYVGGRRETVRLRTRLGYALEGTAEHRIWVRHPSGEEGWKPLGEIRAGDFVALDRQIDLWGSCQNLETPQATNLKLRGTLKFYPLPKRLSTDLSYLLGLLIGDGSIREKNMVSLTTGDDFIAREFCRILREQFGYPAQRLRKSKHCDDYRISSRQIRLFLEELGLGYETAIGKSVPPVVLRAPKEIVAVFLQGLFDTDGYADVKGNVSLSTSSQVLAHQVHTLLLNFGIVSSLQTKKGVRSSPNYLVSIYGAEALTFYREIGFRLPRKQAGVKRVSALRMPNVGGIPYLAPTLKQLQARIVATSDKPVALKRNKSINSIFYTYPPNERNISYFKLDELIEYCRHNDVAFPEIQTVADRRYFYDPVVEVTSGEAEVFDLSVEEIHSFVANGFVNHNSTFLRQTALIVLMAQIGSFVPAESAHIGIVDRIFTRIGAEDAISAGQSTFMVEMIETAQILNHCTPKSLVVLDEIGRGTSTYDGIAIARAVVEYIHNHPRLGAKTLFATHYHELTELENYLPKVRNYNVAVVEQGERVVFLHKIVRGGADKSYGIHVAQLAGVPRVVVTRAQEILAELENGVVRSADLDRHYQLHLFSPDDELRQELAALDVLALSPLEALNKLFELHKKAQK